MSKIKILTIINSAGIGGVEKTLLSCLRNAASENIEMSILCFERDGLLEKDFIDLGVKFFYIKKTGSIFFDMLQLINILKKNKFDIVHSRFGFTSGGFVLASKLMRVKSCVSIHSMKPTSLGNYSVFTRQILKLQLCMHKTITRILATRIIGHSKSNLDTNYPKWRSDKKFILIYNGVDFKQIDNDTQNDKSLESFISKKDYVLLHIGSFRAIKNHLFLISCFNSLNPNKNKYKLILVGSGEHLEKVKTEVERLNITDTVFFAGFDINISKYLAVSNLFILPSINEGLANVLIEAQYKKLPICASKISPLYESGYYGYHKYFFDPLNSEEAINKIKQIISDHKNGNLELDIEKAKLFVSNNFSISNMLSNLLSTYNEISR